MNLYRDAHHEVLFGGVGQDRQVQILRRGVDILVATAGTDCAPPPGR